MARGIEEGDLLAVLFDLVGADMLGDATGFARHHVGFADRVEQRGLAVVDVAHDGHDRRAMGQVLGLVVGRDVVETFFDIGIATRLTVWPSSVAISSAVSASITSLMLDHLALGHQDLDDVDGAFGHAVGEFLDGDRLGNDHFAAELGRSLLVAAHLLVAAATHGGQRRTLVAIGFRGGARRPSGGARAKAFSSPARRVGRSGVVTRPGRAATTGVLGSCDGVDQRAAASAVRTLRPSASERRGGRQVAEQWGAGRRCGRRSAGTTSRRDADFARQVRKPGQLRPAPSRPRWHAGVHSRPARHRSRGARRRASSSARRASSARARACVIGLASGCLAEGSGGAASASVALGPPTAADKPAAPPPRAVRRSAIVAVVSTVAAWRARSACQARRTKRDRQRGGRRSARLRRTRIASLRLWRALPVVAWGGRTGCLYGRCGLRQPGAATVRTARALLDDHGAA